MHFVETVLDLEAVSADTQFPNLRHRAAEWMMQSNVSYKNDTLLGLTGDGI